MEQLFSYLSRFNSTTKNMTADSKASAEIYHQITINEVRNFKDREEQLTEAIFYWNSTKQRNLPKLLKDRYQEVYQ